MSRSSVQQVINDFVQGAPRAIGQPGRVLALRGAWGIGKTYLWESIRRERWGHGKSGHERNHYVYVSLFGIGNLQDLKHAISAGSLVRWGLEDQKEKTKSVSKWSLWRPKSSEVLTHVGGAAVKVLEAIPGVGGGLSSLVGGLGSAIAFGMVRDLLICFDDLERRSHELTIKDFFGLVTQLREERGCDICVILNDGQLADEDAQEIQNHQEKAVDIRLLYDPSPQEAFEVAFKGFVVYDGVVADELVRSCCERLDIRNIRVLQRIRQSLESLAPYLKGRNPRIAEDSIKATILLVWGYHTPRGEAPMLPSFELIRRPGNPIAYTLFKDRDGNMNADQRTLLDLYERYGYSVDEGVDQEIADYVERGYINSDRLVWKLDQESQVIGDRSRRDQLTHAWGLYHNSFDDNEAEVVDAMREALFNHADVIDLNNFDVALGFLRSLDRHELADELAERYARVHEGNENILRFREHSFRRTDISDPKLVEALDLAASQIPEDRKFEDIVDGLSLSQGWEMKDLYFIASHPIEDYEKYMRRKMSNGFYIHIKRLLDFGDIAGSGAHALVFAEVAQKTQKALVSIAQSSRLNRMRVQALGVEVP